MPINFNPENYIESCRGVIKELCMELFPDYSFPLALPDLGDDNLNVEKPVINIEYNNSNSSDLMSGRNNGRGSKVKRKRLRFSFHILTTGENNATLERDRIAQKIEYEFNKPSNMQRLAQRGLHKADVRYMNSYRVREGLHLARLELYVEIKFIY